MMKSGTEVSPVLERALVFVHRFERDDARLAFVRDIVERLDMPLVISRLDGTLEEVTLDRALIEESDFGCH